MSIEIVDARYHKELSVLKGLVEENLNAVVYELTLGIRYGKHTARGASGIHPQHNHTGIPDQWSTGRTR